MKDGIGLDDPALAALFAWPWQWGDAAAFWIASELQRRGLVDRDALPDGYRYELTIPGLNCFPDGDLIAAYQRACNNFSAQDAAALIAEIGRRGLNGPFPRRINSVRRNGE